MGEISPTVKDRTTETLKFNGTYPPLCSCLLWAITASQKKSSIMETEKILIGFLQRALITKSQIRQINIAIGIG